MPTINATIQGDGFPVVFLHGFCENSSMWLPYAQRLTSNYEVVCLDLPGFGKSVLINTEITLEEVAEEVATYLKNIEIEKAVFIGHSLGGYVALALAEGYPEMVRGIGLFHSSAFADDNEAKNRRDKSIEFLRKHPVAKFIRPFIPSLFYSKRIKELQAEVDTATSIGLDSTTDVVLAYTSAMKNRKDRFELWKQLTTTAFSLEAVMIVGYRLISQKCILKKKPTWTDTFYVKPHIWVCMNGLPRRYK